MLGAVLYFYAVFQICASLLGEGALFLLGVAFLSLNPFLLDYLCLSRGYSLGLAWFMYALYQLTLYLSSTRATENPNRVLNKAGIAAGLSIGFNVIMIFPAGALTLAFFALLIAEWTIAKPAEPAALEEERRKKKKERKRQARSAAATYSAHSAWQAMIHMALPAIVVAGIAVTLPRKLVYIEEGYLGPPSIFAILEGIVRPRSCTPPPDSWGSPRSCRWTSWCACSRTLVAPALLLALVVCALALARGSRAGTAPIR